MDSESQPKRLMWVRQTDFQFGVTRIPDGETGRAESIFCAYVRVNVPCALICGWQQQALALHGLPPCLTICLLCQFFQIFTYLSFPDLPCLIFSLWKDNRFFFLFQLVMITVKINYAKAAKHNTYPGIRLAGSGLYKYWQLRAPYS